MFASTLPFHCSVFTKSVAGSVRQRTDCMPTHLVGLAQPLGPEVVDLQIIGEGELSAPFGSLSYHHLHDLLLEEEKILPF